MCIQCKLQYGTIGLARRKIKKTVMVTCIYPACTCPYQLCSLVPCLMSSDEPILFTFVASARAHSHCPIPTHTCSCCPDPTHTLVHCPNPAQARSHCPDPTCLHFCCPNSTHAVLIPPTLILAVLTLPMLVCTVLTLPVLVCTVLTLPALILAVLTLPILFHAVLTLPVLVHTVLTPHVLVLAILTPSALVSTHSCSFTLALVPVAGLHVLLDGCTHPFLLYSCLFMLVDVSATCKSHDQYTHTLLTHLDLCDLQVIIRT